MFQDPYLVMWRLFLLLPELEQKEGKGGVVEVWVLNILAHHSLLVHTPFPLCLPSPIQSVKGGGTGGGRGAANLLLEATISVSFMDGQA